MIRLLAPAKINLGLEVLGKLSDGYHEIRTVYCAVSLFDRLIITRSDAHRVNCTPVPGMVDNLAGTALALASSYDAELPAVSVTIAKRIPAAAGLGGASSDAAAALLGLNALSGKRLTDAELVNLASSCGSDVPFFLRGGIALGAGRGDALHQLPTRPLHVVLIVPTAAVPDKTRRMYSLLREIDWSNGARINRIAETIAAGMPIPEIDLVNAFERALYDLLPEVKAIRDTIEAALERKTHLSGAGPAHYVVCPSAGDALRVCARIRTAIPTKDATVFSVRSVAATLSQELARV